MEKPRRYFHLKANGLDIKELDYQTYLTYVRSYPDRKVLVITKDSLVISYGSITSILFLKQLKDILSLVEDNEHNN